MSKKIIISFLLLPLFFITVIVISDIYITNKPTQHPNPVITYVAQTIKLNTISIEDVKNIFNILFWLTAGVLSILTYLKAKDTVLQPIRTEVVKKQVQIFADVIKKIEESEGFEHMHIIMLNTVFFLSHFKSHSEFVNSDPDFAKILSTRSGSRPIKAYEGNIRDTDSMVSGVDDYSSVSLGHDKKVLLCELQIPKECGNISRLLHSVSKDPFTPEPVSNQLIKITKIFTDSTSEILVPILEEYFNVIYHDFILKGLIVNKIQLYLSFPTIANKYNRVRLDHKDEINKLRIAIKDSLKINELF